MKLINHQEWILEYMEANAKLWSPQNAIINGSDRLMLYFNAKPTELPTSAALDQSESCFIGFPSSSLRLANPIYFFMLAHPHPDIPELRPIWIPEITVPQRKPIETEGPPAIPIKIIGPKI